MSVGTVVILYFCSLLSLIKTTGRQENFFMQLHELFSLCCIANNIWSKLFFNVKALKAVAVIALLLDDYDEEKENLLLPWMSRRKTDGALYTIF